MTMNTTALTPADAKSGGDADAAAGRGQPRPGDDAAGNPRRRRAPSRLHDGAPAAAPQPRRDAAVPTVKEGDDRRYGAGRYAAWVCRRPKYRVRRGGQEERRGHAASATTEKLKDFARARPKADATAVACMPEPGKSPLWSSKRAATAASKPNSHPE